MSRRYSRAVSGRKFPRDDGLGDLQRAKQFLSAVSLQKGVYAYWAAETCSWWVIRSDSMVALGKMLRQEREQDAYSLWCAAYDGDEVKLPRSVSPPAILQAWKESRPHDQSR